MSNHRAFISYFIKNYQNQPVKPRNARTPTYPYLSSVWRWWAHSLMAGLFLSACPAFGVLSLAPLIGVVSKFQSSTLGKWKDQIDKLQQQLDILRDQKRHLEHQLQTQRDQVARFKEYMEFFGNPKKAFGKKLSWKTIDIDEVLRNARGLTEVLQDPLKGVRETTEMLPDIYERIPQTTSYGTAVPYTPEIQVRYSMVDRDLEKAQELTNRNRGTKEALYRDLQHCMEALKAASTDAEVQKINAHINAINGQIALLESYRNEANDHLQAQALHAQNQSEKEQAANIERNLQETQDESDRFEQLSRSVKLRRTR